MRNIFSLIGNRNDNAKATKEINDLIAFFVARIKDIGKCYPEVGIGDTSTDESIVAKIYEEMH